AEGRRAVLDHLLRVERSRAAGDALHEQLRALVGEDAHDALPFVTASTIFFAPSAIVDAAMIARPLSFRILRPSSTFVPSRRTTSGTFSPSCFAAATTPFAITSHRSEERRVGKECRLRWL